MSVASDHDDDDEGLNDGDDGDDEDYDGGGVGGKLVCSTPGCGRSYANLNGLNYHIR